ncbi:helix-turn-helix domain-containing protein (plasmid) [Priestia megaterium]|uniref:helix-turn-helix domain-containing protein n=1 Tax=Priestia TaxID=2800373 RepID=UPI00112D07EA|nr:MULTISPECIES: helix-turn-helix domain-containing protein [Priestia]MDH3177847.1 helix-turn-helix domain-containing protein [Priestia megaterium]
MLWWKNPKRSKFGKWLDSEGIQQTDFATKSKVSRNTVWKLCNDKNYIPSAYILKKIMNAVRKVDNNKHPKDFFDI